MRDVRQVVNALLRKPWYTTSILTVIAVGCALLASVLAVVDGVLLKPLGYPGGSQLVAIQVSASRSRYSPTLTSDDLAAWASAAPGVAFTGFQMFSTDESIGRALVDPNFFDVIGVRPAVGGFAPQDFEGPRPAIEPRVVTDEVFRSRFGGDPGAIGRTVIDDPSTGSGYRIVGVMPRGFAFPSGRLPIGYLTPRTPVFPFNRVGNPVVARILQGATASDVRSRVLAAAVARGALRTDPTDPPVDQVDVQPLARALGARSRPLFAAFLVGAGLLVLVAALNVSSLMAARSLDRGRELAVRRALGATRLDIGRLLLVEAALLVGAGATIGLALAVPLLRVIVPLLPEGLVLFRAAAIDWRVVAFTALVAAALAGLVTIWPLRRATASETRLEPARNVTESARSMSRRLVVSVQVALALVLTVGGALLVGSLLSVYAQTPPITTRGVITIPAHFTGPGSINEVARVVPERAIRVNALLERLRSVPGVDAVAATAADFLNGGYAQPWFVPPATASKARVGIQGQPVTADYYRVIEPQVVAGRLPTAVELANDDPVIVVGEGVASHYWPNASAIGQTLADAGINGKPGLTFTVVGVVKDVRWFSWDAAPTPTIYSPYALRARLPWPTFLVRTSADTSRVSADAVRVMHETDPQLRTGRPALLDYLFLDSVRARRFQAWLFGSFAGASLLVVGIGIFGQLAMSAARRTREVGIRMTCGATRGRIVRLIVGEQLVPVVAGLAVGGIGAAWAVRFVQTYLYQITTSDGRVWTAAISLILLTAAVGTVIPALRASRIDPTQALRAE